MRLELDELSQLTTPCVLHWDLNHFVVLAKVTRDGIVIHDPAVGVRRLPMAVVSRHFTGVALELAPDGEFEPAQAPPRMRLRSVIGRVVGLRRSLGQLFALALAIEVFAVLAPLFMQWVVDHALVGADRDLLLVLALGFAMMLLLRTTVSAMRGWMLIVLGAALKVQSRSQPVRPPGQPARGVSSRRATSATCRRASARRTPSCRRSRPTSSRPSSTACSSS